MRTRNAIKNISISIVSQIIIIILGFISRKVFIDNLGTEYLGINGVLTNVLSMMLIIEAGMGATIVYNLYKPLAEGDKNKIIALIQLYKKVYRILAMVVVLVSCLLYPLVIRIIKTDSNIEGILLVYCIFVIKNILSYLNGYKWALINVDQKGYILARNNLYFQVITTIGKIVVLKVTESYLLFLIIELVIFLIQNIVNTIVVTRRYPYLKTTEKYDIDKDTKENINKNVKAMFWQNAGGYLTFGTDNIIISAFINISTVGLYSNYTMIIGQLSALLRPIITGIGAGVGNLIATEDDKKVYGVFKITYFLSFWIYSFTIIFIYNLIEPFINWWIGEGYLLDRYVLIVILVNFYINGMRIVVGTFKGKAGLFVQDAYVPIIEGIVNLISSLILVKYLGLVGVFLGTIISTLIAPFWNQPRIIYKYLFKESLSKYFSKYLFYAVITLGTGLITTYICNYFISGYSFISLISRGIICVLIPNMVYIIVFFKTEEFKYLFNSIKIHLVKTK